MLPSEANISYIAPDMNQLPREKSNANMHGDWFTRKINNDSICCLHELFIRQTFN